MKHGRPIHLFPFLAALNHLLAQDQRRYETYFCAAHPTAWTSWDTSGAAHLDELHTLTQDVLLRRTKATCLDLPEKLRVLRTVTLSREGHQAYHTTLVALQRQYQERVQSGQILTGGELLVLLNHLRHAGSLAKMPAALKGRGGRGAGGPGGALHLLRGQR